MTKLKKEKTKKISFLISEEDEIEFRKEVSTIVEKYKKYRYLRAKATNA
jgi:hypothetical protein